MYYSFSECVDERIVTKAGNKLPKCLLCNFTYNDLISYKLHQKTVHGFKTMYYPCNKCDHIAPRLARLEVHLRKHNNNKTGKPSPKLQTKHEQNSLMLLKNPEEMNPRDPMSQKLEQDTPGLSEDPGERNNQDVDQTAGLRDDPGNLMSHYLEQGIPELFEYSEGPSKLEQDYCDLKDEADLKVEMEEAVDNQLQGKQN